MGGLGEYEEVSIKFRGASSYALIELRSCGEVNVNQHAIAILYRPQDYSVARNEGGMIHSSVKYSPTWCTYCDHKIQPRGYLYKMALLFFGDFILFVRVFGVFLVQTK